ncbi:MAG: anti-sigma factor family protein [Thermomonas haemolytica]
MPPMPMSSNDSEALQAYLDGEADADARARIEAARLLDPALEEAINRDQRMRERLQGAFDGVLGEPVPDALRRLVEAPAPLARRTASREMRWRAPIYALAASLFLVAAAIAFRLDDSTPWVRKEGALIARGGFASVLDRSLSAAPVGGVRVGLTFLDRGSRWCRSFDGVDGDWQGLACREEGRWHVELLVQDPVINTGELRQAGAGMAPEVLAAIDTRIKGEALDAEHERAVVASGWRRP